MCIYLCHCVMSRRKSFSQTRLLDHALLTSTFLFSFLPLLGCLQAEAILYHASPASLKPFRLPYMQHYDLGYLNRDYRIKKTVPMYLKHPSLTSEKVFQIEPSDAIGGIKYSQPAVGYHQLNSYPGMKVPLSTLFKERIFPLTPQNTSPANFEDQVFSSSEVSEKSSSKPMRDVRYLESVSDKSSHLTEDALDSEYKITDHNIDNVFQSEMNLNDDSSNLFYREKNNFTVENDNLLSIPSDSVLSYETPSTGLDERLPKEIVILKQDTEQTADDVPSLYSGNSKPNYSDSNFSALLPVMKTLVTEVTTETSIVFNTHLYIELMNQTNSTESGKTTDILSTHGEGNFSSSLPSLNNEDVRLSSGTVAGIVIAVLVSVTVLSSAVIYLLYKRYNGKCTSVVESKFNSDNCGYLDDSLRSSIYLNNHIELPKESSEEMTSLDNDSFLNSLETMTIQNYWADNSKNTKV